ncbi:hypothetical protein WB401_37310 [Streptomyces brasiliscabiei]|uniref:Uncharacterized protein n=2 Tax=Streptomyces TaxID=1883 RepID=A0ABU8GUC9_9ACTN|nr:hypothetical protein [Streptomyces griseiscabiei]MBZ3907739.1 hypothetical protein [Streptomyces griseiscabiei]MDX2912574.1 hypothetical protein [Streptomyces griseiscabiei]
MPADPYTVLRALLHAEARRSAPEPTPERAAPEPRRTPATEERPSKRPDRD